MLTIVESRWRVCGWLVSYSLHFSLCLEMVTWKGGEDSLNYKRTKEARRAFCSCHVGLGPSLGASLFLPEPGEFSLPHSEFFTMFLPLLISDVALAVGPPLCLWLALSSARWTFPGPADPALTAVATEKQPPEEAERGWRASYP